MHSVPRDVTLPSLDRSSLYTRVAYSNNIAVTDPAELAQEFTQPHFYSPPAKKSSACRSEATRRIASKSIVRYVAAPWLQEQFWT